MSQIIFQNDYDYRRSLIVRAARFWKKSSFGCKMPNDEFFQKLVRLNDHPTFLLVILEMIH